LRAGFDQYSLIYTERRTVARRLGQLVLQTGRAGMAMVPLAKSGNYLHIYDFRVTPGHEEEFIRLFEEFDYSDGNPMHKSAAQVKDGVLCRDTEDPGRFFLIAEWSDIEEHARIRKILAEELKPAFIKYIEGGKFVPKYVEVVSSTPQHLLDKA
jgi:heme-degrading monooxygenase HmoA